MPQSNDVMANAMVGHMVKQGVKSVGFLGYTDAYGEQWLQALTPLLEKNGIKLLATERFARADTSVTAQALKLTAANPDAMLVVASGSGAAMPHTGPGGTRLQGQDLPDPRRRHART
jgi:branched-chain amino acid transport system substrate-binding protein